MEVIDKSQGLWTIMNLRRVKYTSHTNYILYTIGMNFVIIFVDFIVKGNLNLVVERRNLAYFFCSREMGSAPKNQEWK